MKALLFAAIAVAAHFSPFSPEVNLQGPEYYSITELENSLTGVLNNCSIEEDASWTCLQEGK